MLARHIEIGQKSMLKLGPIANADLIAPRAVARKRRRPDLRRRVAGHGTLQCSAVQARVFAIPTLRERKC